MTNKSTKRTLLTSVLSLFLCFTMLIGTTFAWFTDNATSGSNVITAGNLNIEVQYTLDGKNWNDLKDATDLFRKGLWEPGHTEVVALKITNAGDLALKYVANLKVLSETKGKNANGDDIVLSDLLAVSTLVGGENDVKTAFDNEDAVAYTNTAPLKDSSILRSNAEMLPDDVHYLIVKVDMPSTIGNEANYYGDNAPKIDLGIEVLATQYAYENDSFGNDYDQSASWIGATNIDWYVADPSATEFTISSAEELAGLATIVNGTAGVANSFENKTIKLSSDIDLNNLAWTPIGNGSNGFSGTFDGQGYTVYNLNVSGKNNVGLFGYALNGGNINNLTVENATVTAGDYAGAILGRGYTKVVNCHAVNVNVTVTPYLLADENKYDGGAKAGAVVGQLLEGAGNALLDCTAKDVVITGYRDLGGVLGMLHNNNNLGGCSAQNVTIYYVSVPGTYDNGVTPNQNAGAIVGRIQSTATFDFTEEANSAFTLGDEILVNVKNATELQNALDNATQDTIINFTADITGNVTATQKDNIEVVINGNTNKFTGVMTVFGNGRKTTTALTVKNIDFVAANGASSCIVSPDRTVNNAYSYSSNVTVENCTFTDPDGVVNCAAIRHEDGGDSNWKIVDCVVDNTMHSLVQVNNVVMDGLTIEGCKVYSKNGINLNQCTKVSIIDCEIDVKGYAVRYGVDGATVNGTFEIKDSTLKSANDDGDAVIIFRGTMTGSTLTITNTTLVGNPEISGNANVVRN